MDNLDFGPVDFIRLLDREDFTSLGFDDDMCMFLHMSGHTADIPRDMTRIVLMDDVPEISVKQEPGKVTAEISFASRDLVKEEDIVMAGLQNGRRLLFGWHSVHRGSLSREGESTSPRKEGAPVKYTLSQPLMPLEARLLY